MKLFQRTLFTHPLFGGKRDGLIIKVSQWLWAFVDTEVCFRNRPHQRHGEWHSRILGDRALFV